MPWRAALGARVRECRMDRGWSVRKVATKSHVAQTTWRRLEAGEPVSDWTLIEVADVLGWPRGQCFRIIAKALDDAEQAGRS